MCRICDGTVSPHEKHLTISDCDKVREIPFMASVASLFIFNCTNLHTISALPSLITLAISGCPITRLPAFSSLTSLSLEKCAACVDLILDCSELTSLSICDCVSLRAILINQKARVASLVIADCPVLCQLPDIGVSKLRSVYLVRCPILRGIPVYQWVSELVYVDDCPMIRLTAEMLAGFTLCVD